VFLDGFTYTGIPSGTPPLLQLERWVQLDANGSPVAITVGGATPGAGFPGVQSAFQGSAKLISPKTLCFVADSDNDLSTFETSRPAARSSCASPPPCAPPTAISCAARAWPTARSAPTWCARGGSHAAADQ
jgi:hypothetical protein